MSRALHDVATGTLFGVALNYQGLLKQRLAEFEQPPYQKPPLKPVLFIKTPIPATGTAPMWFTQVAAKHCNQGRRLAWSWASRPVASAPPKPWTTWPATPSSMNSASRKTAITAPPSRPSAGTASAPSARNWCPPLRWPTPQPDDHAVRQRRGPPAEQHGQLRSQHSPTDCRDQRVHDPACRRRADHRHA